MHGARSIVGRMILCCGAGVLAACGSSIPDLSGLGPSSPPTRYDLTPIGTQYGDSSHFVGLNDGGTIVGQVWIAGQPQNTVVRHNVAVDIGTCVPAGVNESGVVACEDGSLWTSSSRTPVVSTAGNLQPVVRAINDAGQIAGELVTESGTAPSCGSDCIFLYWGSGDTAIVSGAFAGGSPIPRLNIDSGLVTVVGHSHTTPTMAYLTSKGVSEPLGCSGIDASASFSAVGGANVLVGQSGGLAIMCVNGTMKDLGQGALNDISRGGVVVGTSGAKGFVYDGTRYEVLDDVLTASGSGYSIVSADLVNDNGQIIATAQNIVTGKRVQVLLTRVQ